jgi:hypothetical protein
MIYTIEKSGTIITINSERGSIFEQNTNITPWEINLLPAFAKEAGAAALASYFMGRRMAKMNPADILRRL